MILTVLKIKFKFCIKYYYKDVSLTYDLYRQNPMLDYGDSKNLIHTSPDLVQKVTGSGPVLTPLFFNTDNLVLFRFALRFYIFSLLSGYCFATLEKIYRVVQSLEPPLSCNCLSETALPYCTSNKHLMGKNFY